MKRAQLIRLAVSTGCVSLAAGPAAAALVFNAGASAITYRHDVVEGGAVNRTKVQPAPAIQTPSTVTFVLPDLTLTGASDSIGTLKSRAKVGFARNETATVGTGVVKSGSLLTQADPGNAALDVFSTLEIAYNLHWNVTAPGFGPPIIGSFSVPLLAVIGAGGAAQAQIIDMHWERFDGLTTTDLRSVGNAIITFGPGTTLTSLSVPGAAFVPSGLTTGDQFIVRGTLKLSVKNADDPVAIVLDPDYQELVVDDGAVVQYRFDDGPPGTSPAVAADSAPPGGATDGTYTGGAQITAGLRSGALLLDGVNDAVVQGNLQSTQSLTVELWAASAQPTWTTGGWLTNSNGPNGFVINPIAGTTQWQGIVLDAAGNPHIIGTIDTAADLTQLHHYAITFDEATHIARMFFDGSEVITTDLGAILRNAGIPQTMTLGLGAGGFGAGVIDEFAYYDQALRAEVLQSHFLVGRSDPGSFQRLIGAEVLADTADTPEPGTFVLLILAGAVGLTRRRDDRRSSALSEPGIA